MSKSGNDSSDAIESYFKYIQLRFMNFRILLIKKTTLRWPSVSFVYRRTFCPRKTLGSISEMSIKFNTSCHRLANDAALHCVPWL